MIERRGATRAEDASQLSSVVPTHPECIATVTLTVDTHGQGFTEITRDVAEFILAAGAADGVLLMFIRHTSAALVIQENADPEVLSDLRLALDRVAPADAGWRHTSEGVDDMPAHVKSMLTGVSLHIPVIGGSLALGTWQGIYVAEYRSLPHRREVVLQFIGSRRHL